MKKYDKTDDFFREALKDHQITPSDAAKKAFLRDALLTPPPEKKGRKGLVLFTALLLLVSAEIVLWTLGSDLFSSVAVKGTQQIKQTQTSSEQLKTIVYNETPQTNQTKQTNQTQLSKADHTSKHTNNPLKSTLTVPVLSGQNDKTTAQSLQPDPSIAGVINEKKHNISSGEENTYQEGEIKAPVNVQNPSLVNPVVSDTGSYEMTKKSDSLPVPVSATKEKTRNASGRTSPWIPSIGIYYTPEWMFNTLEGTKFINNFGIEGTFHFDRFSVRTGAGLSVGKGTNELVVAYNDFIGAYNQLDSMSFTWNDPTHNYIPTMYTSKKDVWDSLMKLDYPKVVKRYTYLQIPMILGYDFWQTDLITIGARMGPVMSILLTSKQLSAAYDPGNKKIISINDIAPEQVNLNWQVMAGLSGAIRLTRTLQIEVEPSVRYYFNSVYEKPVNNNKPWSVWVRAAFVVKF